MPNFSIDNAKRLYEEGMERLNLKREKELIELEKLNGKYTYKPKIHQAYFSILFLL